MPPTPALAQVHFQGFSKAVHRRLFPFPLLCGCPQRHLQVGKAQEEELGPWGEELGQPELALPSEGRWV